MARIADETGTRVLPQMQGTWTFKWFPGGLAKWIGLPIDNILAGAGVTVHSATTLHQIGSDHLPILLEFSLEPAGGPEPKPTGIPLS